MFLCGHSLGGPVAIELAANDPGLFSTIIIVSGSIDVSQEKKEIWRRIMNVPPLSNFLPGAFAPSNTEILYLKKDLILLQEQFKKVTCNVHFIHGSKDTWVPIENVAYGTKMLINAKSITSDTLFGADHLIPWKNQKEFTSLLLKLY
jgi:pimeloyl-ACP methyl ester carboxylesterase